MAAQKTKELIALLQSINHDELLELERDLDQIESGTKDKEYINTIKVVRRIIKNINNGEDFQQTIRAGVNEIVKMNYQDSFVFSRKHLYNILTYQEEENLTEKHNQIYDLLDGLQDRVSGDDTEEATMVFSAILDIVSQICSRRTDGIVSIRIRLDQFFELYEGDGHLKPEYARTVNLHFSPEEVTAMQMRLPEMPKDDPMTHFFTHVLHQAYDMIRFSEITGNLLLIMSSYFIDKIEEPDERLDDFIHRHKRAAVDLQKAVENVSEVEQKINVHLSNHPILSEFPKYIRALFNDKLGLPCSEMPEVLIRKIQAGKEEYSRVRATVAFDFNLLPTVQRNIFFRQSAVLDLQKDLVAHLYKKQKETFGSIKKELDQITNHIETRSKELQKDSPEYNTLLSKRRLIQKRIEESRRRLDVLRSQFKLVDIQKQLVQDAIKRHQAEQHAAEKTVTLNPAANGSFDHPPQPVKQKAIRMVTAKKLTRGRR